MVVFLLSWHLCKEVQLQAWLDKYSEKIPLFVFLEHIFRMIQSL